MARTYSIAELARATGVPVKTIRRYADHGLVAKRAARYRDGDRLRVVAIQQLRALAVPVAEIRRRLAPTAAVRDVLALHLTALDHERANATRAAAAVRAALALPRLDPGEVLRRLDALARIATIERRTVAYPAAIRSLAEMRTSVVEAAFRDLPDDLTDAQWTALGELVDLLDDRRLAARIDDDARAGLRRIETRFDRASWRQLVEDLVAQAHGAWIRHDPPTGRRGKVLATRWVNHAASLGRVSMYDAAAELLRRAERQDPRIDRAWELVAIIRGWAGPPPHIAALRWLVEAVRANLDGFRRLKSDQR